jgi:hypothetical protein
MNDDHQLRETFQASRASERADAPSFGRVMAGRDRSAGRRRGLVPGLIAVGGVAVLTIAVLSRGRRPDPALDLELARKVMAWRSPTDFLLPASVPGLLSSVPRIDQAPAGSPLQALDPGSVLGPPVFPRSPRT